MTSLKNASANTNNGLFFLRGWNIPSSHKKGVSIFASFAMSHYKKIGLEPFELFITRITDCFFSSAQLPSNQSRTDVAASEFQLLQIKKKPGVDDGSAIWRSCGVLVQVLRHSIPRRSYKAATYVDIRINLLLLRPAFSDEINELKKGEILTNEHLTELGRTAMASSLPNSRTRRRNALWFTIPNAELINEICNCYNREIGCGNQPRQIELKTAVPSI